MKKVLSVLAVAALVVLGFTSCGTQEKTLTDYLTQSKGWVLASATSSPAYEMASGEYVTDLMNGGYLYDYENEYVIVFSTNGNQIVKPGKTVAPSAEDGYIAETSLGNYQLLENTTIGSATGNFIKMQVPFFYDEEQEVCRILTLNDNEFKILCTVNDDDVTSKGTYTFTLTYVPAK